ncbi:MAG TPA: Gfo/Idh/MocA family oxidoreductase [Chthonomonadaceae bacterium]|nr:Gfo/Idh/MocA family oxidoreductase [Chthonomonadaceae bacterium]
MLNIAVIGCGKMASDLARRSVRMGRARIAAIHDIDPKTLAEKATEFGADAEPEIERLARREDIDAFLVGSPPLAHHANVLAVAPTGKPIYSEKPLCTTVALCDEMIAACRAHKGKLFVGQVLRLFPLFWKSHEILQEGILGKPEVVSITRAEYKRHFSGGWRARKEESGGLLGETNVHEIDYMRFLMGEVETVFAQGKNLTGWGDFDDTLFVQLQFKNGGIGMLHGSLASPAGEYRVHIQGTKGNLLHGGFGGELRYRAFDADAPTVITVQDMAGYPDPYDRELVSFFDWIENDTPPLFTGEIGRANVAVVEAGYRSLESGRPEPVTIPEA